MGGVRGDKLSDSLFNGASGPLSYNKPGGGVSERRVMSLATNQKLQWPARTGWGGGEKAIALYLCVNLSRRIWLTLLFTDLAMVY